jgi:hypothetical protein
LCSLKNDVALAKASAIASLILNAIRLRALRHALDTIKSESPCLSENRNSVDRKEGNAYAMQTTVSQGERTGEVLTELTGLALFFG